MISRVVRSVSAVVLVLGLAACTDDDPDAGGGAPAAGSSQTSEAGSAATSEATPTAPESPSVVPATGKKVSVEAVSMRLTDSPDWALSQFGTTFVANLPLGDKGIFHVTVQDILAGGRTTEDKAVSFERTLAREEGATPKRVANRVVDGVECFVLEGRDEEDHDYIVGGVVNDRFFLLRFEVPNALRDGDLLIEQMLATADIKD